jgi:hypothetical protein
MEKPILFSGAMVCAILDGRKTQTRRVIKKNAAGRAQLAGHNWHLGDPNAVLACPYGQKGDALWVREIWRPLVDAELLDCIEYKADDKRLKPQGLTEEEGHHFDNMCENIEVTHGKVCRQKWKPSIFMPRWASRIALKITDVRVKRVQEISEQDASAEGVESALIAEGETGAGPCQQYSYIQSFGELWDLINAKRGYGWNTNPWVWSITFEMFHGATGKDGE